METSDEIKHPSGSGSLKRGGYCIWKFEDQGWVIVKSECKPGFQPGPPPKDKPKFKGDVVRKSCEPDS